MATEEAFPMTPVGEVQVRELPPTRLLVSESEGTYFDQSNRLFRRLFDYIKTNQVDMTVPVEAELRRAEMRFYVGSQAPDKLSDTSSVKVTDAPKRTVAAIGGRGAYSESNLTDAQGELERWLASQKDWRASSEAYAVFWNGPFTPWFLKRFEVHVPVEPAT